MAEKTEIKPDALPDLDDLLQCPVCYEIPSGQIFQCNEGHHVCGRCKMRLDVCPVCRAFFFGTRNYAMEELIANVRKLRAFKLGGKVTTGTAVGNNTPPKEENSDEAEEIVEDEDNNHNFASRPAFRAPQACKGLFRCLCCKNGNAERLPSARLLNHLRYYHAPELLEGTSESGEYLQAWQFSTNPGRIVTAVRVADMGIFFLIIEISNDSLCAWLTMAASPWVAHEFCYTVTISGNDREAIFSDCVWSVRSCEGSLKKRGHCLVVSGLDARALIAPSTISGKLSVKRVPTDLVNQNTQPRAIVRVASRGNPRDNALNPVNQDLEPFLQDLQNDVARLSRAFVRLGREANALVRSEAEIRSRIDNAPRAAPPERPVPPPVQGAQSVPQINHQPDNSERVPMSRNARRRMRHRVRAALNATQPPPERNILDSIQAAVVPPMLRANINSPQPGNVPQRANIPSNAQRNNVPAPSRANVAQNATQRQNGPTTNHVVFSGLAILQEPPVPPPIQSASSSNGFSQNGNQNRNKKSRRHRR